MPAVAGYACHGNQDAKPADRLPRAAQNIYLHHSPLDLYQVLKLFPHFSTWGGRSFPTGILSVNMWLTPVSQLLTQNVRVEGNASTHPIPPRHQLHSEYICIAYQYLLSKNIIIDLRSIGFTLCQCRTCHMYITFHAAHSSAKIKYLIYLLPSISHPFS